MLQITPTSPYAFDVLLDVLRRFHPVLDSVQGGTLRRLFADTLVEASAQDGGLSVRALAGALTPDVLAQVRHVLSVDDDWRAFYDYARQDAALWRVIAPTVGIRHVKALSAFEALVTTVTEQQISLKAAQRGQRWLVETYGARRTHDGTTCYRFPEAADLAGLSAADLKPLKITDQRSRVVLDFARRIAAGMLDLDALCALPPDEAFRELCRFKGIGPWTAAWVLMKYRGAFHWTPANDVALQAAVNRYFFGAGGRCDEKVLQRHFAAYGKFAGLAAYHTETRYVLDVFPVVV